MVKKKSSAKESSNPLPPAPSKQSLDDFLAHWSDDDDDDEQDEKVLNGGKKFVANGNSKAVNGHKVCYNRLHKFYMLVSAEALLLLLSKALKGRNHRGPLWAQLTFSRTQRKNWANFLRYCSTKLSGIRVTERFLYFSLAGLGSPELVTKNVSTILHFKLSPIRQTHFYNFRSLQVRSLQAKRVVMTVMMKTSLTRKTPVKRMTSLTVKTPTKVWIGAQLFHVLKVF